MQDGAEILAKQSAHVLFLAGGPPALQETNVAAPGRYHNSDVRGLFRVRNGDSWKRKGNNGMRLAILWRKYWHDQDNKIELYRQNRIILIPKCRDLRIILPKTALSIKNPVLKARSSFFFFFKLFSKWGYIFVLSFLSRITSKMIKIIYFNIV